MDDRLAKWLLENNLLEQIRVLKTDVALLQKLGATTDIYDPIFISGTGDVVGPNSSTDGNVALFNGTTGKIIKEGGVPVIGVEDGVAGATLAYGNLVYLSSVDDRWELASASAEATCSKKLGICILTAANDGDATKVLTTGNVTSNSFPAMTVGQAIYAGTTAGTISTTPPSSNAGEIIRIVGHALGANVLYFHPSSDFFEIGTPTSGNLGYTIKFEGILGGPMSASASYWVGCFLTIGAGSSSDFYVYPPKAGTIKYFETYVSTSSGYSSGEAADINVYKNGTIILSNVATMDVAFAHGSSGVSNISIIESDELIVEVATPAWSVNPNMVLLTVVLYIE
jgi:hypothetical protein